MEVHTVKSAKHSLVDFMIKPDDRFFFSRQREALIIPHDWFCEILPSLQHEGGSTIWGTTWPYELPFWNSSGAVDFLARQVIDFENTGSISRRIAISTHDIVTD